jgi:hypothetical protein
MGIVQATLSDAANNKIYNITRSADEEYTLLRAAQLAIEVAGGYGTIHPEGRDLSFPNVADLISVVLYETLNMLPLLT